MLYMLAPRFDQRVREDGRGAAAICAIKTGKVENALSPPGARGS